MQKSDVFFQLDGRRTIFEIGAAIVIWFVGRAGRCDEESEGQDAFKGTQFLE
jgi:hypothetical protein